MTPVLLFVFGTYLKVPPPLDKNYQKFHKCDSYGEVRDYFISSNTDREDIYYNLLVMCKDTSINRIVSQTDLLKLNKVPK